MYYIIFTYSHQCPSCRIGIMFAPLFPQCPHHLHIHFHHVPILFPASSPHVPTMFPSVFPSLIAKSTHRTSVLFGGYTRMDEGDQKVPKLEVPSGRSMAMVVPRKIAGWFIWENAMNIWMMTRGTPILGNPQIDRKVARLVDKWNTSSTPCWKHFFILFEVSIMISSPRDTLTSSKC